MWILLLTAAVESDDVEALSVLILAVGDVLLVVNRPMLVMLVGPGLGGRRVKRLSRFPAHKREEIIVHDRDATSCLVSIMVLATCLLNAVLSLVSAMKTMVLTDMS